MRLTHFFILSSLAFGGLSVISSCNDDSTSMGSSLVGDDTEVVIDSAFTVTGSSEKNSAVLSRTTTQLLGALNAAEYGSFSSDFVTQFMPTASIDTAGVGVNDIDSIKLIMFFQTGDFTGDSLVPMGFKVYPLTRQLETPIYSNFNPAGYYEESNCWTPQTQIYTGNALFNDSINKSYARGIHVKLPVEFGRAFYREYLEHPATFANPEEFAKFFPGIYVKNTFGSGRVTNITQTQIGLYYTKHSTITTNGETRDTLKKCSSLYMGVTPEIISNNIINLSMSPEIQKMVDEGKSLLVAPAGYNAKVVLPLKDVVERYKANGGDLSVINTLTLQIPVERIPNKYNIAPPANVLFVLEKDAKSFFADNKINDDKTSFLSTFNSLTNSYYVTALRSYLLTLLDKEEIKPEDYTFSIIPVSVQSESGGNDYYYGTSQSYVTAIEPYVNGPAMCRLKLEEAKIRFTYSKQSVKN